MPELPDQFFALDDLAPSLREVFAERIPDPKKFIAIAVPVKDPNVAPAPAGTDRREIGIISGKEFWSWEVPSLQELFRGNKQPPVLGDHPEFYNDCFAFLELHVLEISKFFGERRDSEMKEIYSNLRRRPDGKSLGFVHDYMWQAAALLLGTHVLSQAEFDAIMARLERSCRRFEQGPVSRNYVAALQMTFGKR